MKIKARQLTGSERSLIIQALTESINAAEEVTDDVCITRRSLLRCITHGDLILCEYQYDNINGKED